jgi:hypothetical protein
MRQPVSAHRGLPAPSFRKRGNQIIIVDRVMAPPARRHVAARSAVTHPLTRDRIWQLKVSP